MKRSRYICILQHRCDIAARARAAHVAQHDAVASRQHDDNTTIVVDIIIIINSISSTSAIIIVVMVTMMLDAELARGNERPHGMPRRLDAPRKVRCQATQRNASIEPAHQRVQRRVLSKRRESPRQLRRCATSATATATTCTCPSDGLLHAAAALFGGSCCRRAAHRNAFRVQVKKKEAKVSPLGSNGNSCKV